MFVEKHRLQHLLLIATVILETNSVSFHWSLMWWKFHQLLQLVNLLLFLSLKIHFSMNKLLLNRSIYLLRARNPSELIRIFLVCPPQKNVMSSKLNLHYQLKWMMMTHERYDSQFCFVTDNFYLARNTRYEL